jgi:hypothetical protein
VQGYRRKNGHFRYQDQNLVCLYFIPHYGLTADRLFYPCLLDEYEEVYYVGATKSAVVSINYFFILLKEEKFFPSLREGPGVGLIN